MWRPRFLLAALVLASCGGDPGDEKRPERPSQDKASQPAPPPDAGTQAGHGADPRRVAVPRDDRTPPTATIVLEAPDGTPFAEAAQPPGKQPHGSTELPQPRLSATTVGRDPDGGVARVRISIKERVTCRGRDGRSFMRRRTRYFPPPQIVRIRSNPGASIPTEDSRTLALALGRGPCGRARAVAVEGELWGEATNGTGLEAVTPHLRFRWRR